MSDISHDTESAAVSTSDGWTHKSIQCTSENQSEGVCETALHWDQRPGSGGRSELNRDSVVVAKRFANTDAQAEFDALKVRQEKHRDFTFDQHIRTMLTDDLKIPKDEVDEKYSSVVEAFASSMEARGEGDVVAQLRDIEGVPAFLRSSSEVTAEQLKTDMLKFIRKQERGQTIMGGLLCGVHHYKVGASAAMSKLVSHPPMSSNAAETALVHAIESSDQVDDPHAAYEAAVMCMMGSKELQYAAWSDLEALKSGHMSHPGLN